MLDDKSDALELAAALFALGMTIHVVLSGAAALSALWAAVATIWFANFLR
jgi:hypothetical protein